MMSELVAEVQQDSEVRVQSSHPIVLDMLAGLVQFISSECNDEECTCEECGTHSSEYVAIANELYQSAATDILTSGKDQWSVLDEVLVKLKSIEDKELYVGQTGIGSDI